MGPPNPRWFSPIVVVTLVGFSTIAQAGDVPPRAAYASADELPPEGLPHQLDVSLGARYMRLIDRPEPDRLSGLRNIGTFELRSRALIGGAHAAYCAGVDAHVGASDTGAAYGATLYAIGLGLRARRGTFFALCGGVGGDGIVGSVPGGAVFPAELSFGLPLGPLRPVGWVRASWIAGAPERRHGSTTDRDLDELEAGLAIRLGRQDAYWAEMNAGHGPSIGFLYREFMGARAVAVTLALELSGGQ
jgi:hypothetical protein